MFLLFTRVVIPHVKVSLLCSSFSITDAALHDVSQHGASTGRSLKELFSFFFFPKFFFGGKKKKETKNPGVLLTKKCGEGTSATVREGFSLLHFKLRYIQQLPQVQISDVFDVQTLR